MVATTLNATTLLYGAPRVCHDGRQVGAHLCSTGTWLMMKSTAFFAPGAPAFTELKEMTGFDWAGGDGAATLAAWLCCLSVPVVCNNLVAAPRADRRRAPDVACIVSARSVDFARGCLMKRGA